MVVGEPESCSEILLLRPKLLLLLVGHKLKQRPACLSKASHHRQFPSLSPVHTIKLPCSKTSTEWHAGAESEPS